MNNDVVARLMEIPYVLGGRSYEGLDCWGLVVIAYKELFSIDLPTYDSVAWSVSNDDTTSDEIEDLLRQSAPFEEVYEPQFGDFVLLNILGDPVHIGFMLNSTTMLHTSEKTGTVCENIRGVKWKRRVKGFYRHLEMI